MHDVSNIQTVDPFVLIQIAKDVFHIRIPNVESQIAGANPEIRLFLGHFNHGFPIQTLLNARRQGMVSLLQRTRDWHSPVLKGALVLNGHSFQDGLENGQELHGRLLDQAKVHVANDADFGERLVLDQLLRVVGTHVFAVVNQVVRDHDGFVGVEGCISVLVDLAEESANLHVGFALVLQQLQLQGGVERVVEELSDLWRFQKLQAFIQAGSTLIKHAQLLVAQCHIVVDEKVHKLVMRVVLGLDLFEHGLGLLKEDKALLVGLLGNEVDSRLAQLVNNDWHLV